MTSQRWLTDSEFSAGSQSGSIWWHYLVVIVPENVKYTRNGTLWITGYSMSTIPDQHNEDVIYTAALATNVGIVTGILFQVKWIKRTRNISRLICLFPNGNRTDPQRAHDFFL
jgi:hypothetical protein